MALMTLTLDYKFALAQIYGLQKRYDEAAEIMIHVIETKRRLIGSQRPWNMLRDVSG
jgi:hypothetical protein